jgi:hypothetical protein
MVAFIGVEICDRDHVSVVNANAGKAGAGGGDDQGSLINVPIAKMLQGGKHRRQKCEWVSDGDFRRWRAPQRLEKRGTYPLEFCASLPGYLSCYA